MSFYFATKTPAKAHDHAGQIASGTPLPRRKTQGLASVESLIPSLDCHPNQSSLVGALPSGELT